MSPAQQTIPHSGIPNPIILLGAGEFVLKGLEGFNGLTFVAGYTAGPSVTLERSTDQGSTWGGLGGFPHLVQPGEWIRLTRTDTSGDASLIGAVYDVPTLTQDLNDSDYGGFALVNKSGTPLHFQYRDGSGTLHYSPAFTTTSP